MAKRSLSTMYRSFMKWGKEHQFAGVIVVWVPEALQRERLKDRDHLSEEQIIDRLQSQLSLESKRERADFVIDNSGERSETRKTGGFTHWAS